MVKRPRFLVLSGDGINCERETAAAVESAGGLSVITHINDFLYEKNRAGLQEFQGLCFPGGFSFGDELGSGQIMSLKMKAHLGNDLEEFVASGKLIIGICNGFQILAEAGLLPGALLRNVSMKYICKFLYLRTETTDTPYTNLLTKGQLLRIPIGHGDGNFFAGESTLRRIEDNDQVVFRYADAEGRITAEANPNGSLNNIAGIVNEQRNVLGMMPHPDRSSEEILGSADGKLLFESMVNALVAG